MTWSKMSDDWPDHPKVVMCSDPAVALWMRSIAYANRHSTDGFVPASMLSRLTRDRRPNELARELVEAIPPTYSKGLWEPVEGGWMIHDFLDYSPSRADVTAKRKADAERQAKHRATRDSHTESRCDNSASNAVSLSAPSRPVPTLTDPDPPLPPRKRVGTPRTVKSVLDPDWHPGPEHAELARKELGRDGAWVSEQAKRMRDWAEAKGARYADWNAMFRNWLRREAERPQGQAPGQRYPSPANEPDPRVEADKRIAQTNALLKDRLKHIPKPVRSTAAPVEVDRAVVEGFLGGFGKVGGA